MMFTLDTLCTLKGTSYVESFTVSVRLSIIYSRFALWFVFTVSPTRRI